MPLRLEANTLSCGEGLHVESVARRIVGFHLDPANHWVAELECGHQQHVRHDPPWTERPWVRTPEERAKAIGRRLRCLACERGHSETD